MPKVGCVELDGFQVISWGYATTTPWHSPREVTEDAMAMALDGLVGQLDLHRPVIFNFHDPPIESGLDLAYTMTPDMKVVMAGGQLLAEPMDVMDVGRMAIAADPAGAAFGIWQARLHVGFGVANEAGSVIWNEHMSRDWQAAKDFYAAVFDWEYSDMSGDGFHYATFRVAGREVGGIGEAPPDTPADQPAGWMTYFAVTDTDLAADKIVELGGSTAGPPRDTPYGRMAVAADNQGAPFSVMSAPADGAAAEATS